MTRTEKAQLIVTAQKMVRGEMDSSSKALIAAYKLVKSYCDQSDIEEFKSALA